MPAFRVVEAGARIGAPPRGSMSVTLVGSGVSTAIPVIGHLSGNCACADAMEHPNGPNCRNNISLLITLPTMDAGIAFSPRSQTSLVSTNHASFAVPTHNQLGDATVRSILIDAGKTFRDAYFRVLAPHGLRSVDALLLTHGHADAIGGLDDLRDLQTMRMEGGDWYVDHFIPTFLHQHTLEDLHSSVGYIVRNSHYIGHGSSTAEKHAKRVDAHRQELIASKGADKWNCIGIRRSTALQLFTLPEDRPKNFVIPGLHVVDGFSFYSLPVEHGAGYISLGFVFGSGVAFRSDACTATMLAGKSCVAYISDVSDIPPLSMKFLLDLVKIDVLYIDCLHTRGKSSPVHYAMDDVLALVVKIRPTYVYGVGMYCDVEHHEGKTAFAAALAELVESGALKPGEVECIDLGYDGLEIVLPQ